MQPKNKSVTPPEDRMKLCPLHGPLSSLFFFLIDTDTLPLWGAQLTSQLKARPPQRTQVPLISLFFMLKRIKKILKQRTLLEKTKNYNRLRQKNSSPTQFKSICLFTAAKTAGISPVGQFPTFRPSPPSYDRIDER
jgi:hypothetical protein